MKFLRIFILFWVLFLPCVNAAEINIPTFLAINETEEEEINKIPNEPIQIELEYNIINETKPLFSEYTHKNFESGVFKSFKPYFVYKGVMNFNLSENGKNNVLYNNSLLDLNIIGEMQAPIEYASSFNFLSMGHVNYLSTFVKDQYIAYNKIPHHKIFIGRYKPTIGVEGCMSNYTQPFITSSQLARNYGIVRSFGTKIKGSYDLIDYTIGIGSSDRKLREFFPGGEIYNWVDLKPLGKTDGKFGELKIGAGIDAGKLHNNYFITSTGVGYKYKKIGIFGEYAFADGSNGLSGFTNKHSQGTTLTASYNLTKQLQFLLRYDLFNQKKENTITEYSAGLNWFIKGSSLKFMLNYVYSDKSEGSNSHKILAGTQVIL